MVQRLVEIMRTILTLILSVYEAGRAVSASYTDCCLNKGEDEHPCLIHPPEDSPVTFHTRGVESPL